MFSKRILIATVACALLVFATAATANAQQVYGGSVYVQGPYGGTFFYSTGYPVYPTVGYVYPAYYPTYVYRNYYRPYRAYYPTYRYGYNYNNRYYGPRRGGRYGYYR